MWRRYEEESIADDNLPLTTFDAWSSRQKLIGETGGVIVADEVVWAKHLLHRNSQRIQRKRAESFTNGPSTDLAWKNSKMNVIIFRDIFMKK